MKHLEAAFRGKNAWWRYLVMVVAILVVSNIIGAMPLIIVMVVRMVSDPEAAAAIASDPNNLSALGLDTNFGLLLMLIPFVAALLAIAFLIKPLNERSFMDTINGRTAFRWNRFLISALVWLILSAVYLIISLKTDPDNITLHNTTATLIPLILITVIFIPFQAAFEEVLFRGYLMQGFGLVVKRRWFPLIMTSILFGLMHGLNPEIKEYGFFTMMPQYIMFGIIFAVITILDDGVEAAMGAHAANNAFLCIMVTSESSALQTQALFVQHTIDPWAEFRSMIIMGALVIIILTVIFRWRNFASLFGKIENVNAENQIP